MHYHIANVRDRRSFFIITAVLVLLVGEFLASFMCFVAALAFHDVASDMEVLGELPAPPAAIKPEGGE